MAVSATPCVYFAPKSLRPWYDPATDEEPNDCVCALSLGPPFRYVISGFDVLAVEMRQIRIKGYTTAGEERTYDIFVRNDPSVNRCYPVWMEIKDATIVEVGGLCIPYCVGVLWCNCLYLTQEKEFSMCVKTEGLKLIPQGVLVVWEWEWQDSDSDVDHVSESSCEDVGHKHHNPHLQSDSRSSSETESATFELPALTHIVTFKCIG